MKIEVKIEDWAYMPEKAHAADAGADLRSPAHFTVPAYHSVVIDTGVHMAIPEGYVGMIKSKSGLNVKHGLTCEGVVDSGYTGTIVAMIRNDSPNHYRFERGDKLTQIVILPIPDVEFIEVEELGETERGDGGFGSTGR